MTKKCNFLITNEMNKSKSYICERISSCTWYVTWKPVNDEATNSLHSSNTGIPIFKRLRIVTYESEILKCSCPCFAVDGFPCRHIINVAYSIEGYKGLSHHDISVKYWNLYHFFSKKSNRDSSLSKIMKFLTENDATGIFVPRDLIRIVPIVSEDDRSNEFKFKSPFCINYPTINDLEVPVDAAAGMEVSMSQSICDMELDDENNFEVFTEANIENTNNIKHNSKSVYNQVSPIFKALCSVFESQAEEADVQRLKEYLYKEMSRVKKKFIDKNETMKPTGTLISTHIPSCKRRKTHGCDPFR